uniref:Uncharacterized protein n=1 Tax=Glossina pallidipes TaxID=7398 RepID=A0A1A9ZN09_GLOPL
MWKNEDMISFKKPYASELHLIEVRSTCFVACFIYLRLPELPKFEEETHNDGAQWFFADAFYLLECIYNFFSSESHLVNVVELKSVDNKLHTTLMLDKVHRGRQQGCTNLRHHNAIKLSLVTVANGNANVWLMTVSEKITQYYMGIHGKKTLELKTKLNKNTADTVSLFSNHLHPSEYRRALEDSYLYFTSPHDYAMFKVIDSFDQSKLMLR